MAGPPHGAVDFELAGQRYGQLLDLGISMGVKPAMEVSGFAQEVNSIGAALRIWRTPGIPRRRLCSIRFTIFEGGAGCEGHRKADGGSSGGLPLRRCPCRACLERAA